MTLVKSHYAVLGVSPYASVDEISDAYGKAKQGFDRTRADSIKAFAPISEAYGVLVAQGRASRDAYDDAYYPQRAEAMLAVLKQMINMAADNIDETNMEKLDAPLKSSIEALTPLIEQHGVAIEEIEMLGTRLFEGVNADDAAGIKKAIDALSAQQVLAELKKLKAEFLPAAAEAPVQATVATVSHFSKAAAEVEATPAAQPEQRKVEPAKQVDAEAYEARTRALQGVFWEVIRNPADKTNNALFIDALRKGEIDATWLVQMAKENEKWGNTRIGYGEYRAVLGVMADAITQVPNVAFHGVFESEISRYAFKGLELAPRSGELHAHRLFEAVLRANPYAISREAFADYCNLPIESSPREGNMEIRYVQSVINVRPELAFAARNGLASKLYVKVNAKDANGQTLQTLFDALLEKGAIDTAWFEQAESMNDSRRAMYANGDKGADHQRMAHFLAEGRSRLRPGGLYHPTGRGPEHTQ